MICPMKISALANPHIGEPGSNPNNVDKFLECSKENCAWWSKNNVSCIMLQLDRLEDICYKLEVLAEVV